MTANIRDKSLCDEACEIPREPGYQASQGDVRYCRHKRIWYCLGNTTEYMWTSYGFWRLLHPFWDRRQYKKALAALGA